MGAVEGLGHTEALARMHGTTDGWFWNRRGQPEPREMDFVQMVEVVARRGVSKGFSHGGFPAVWGEAGGDLRQAE